MQEETQVLEAPQEAEEQVATQVEGGEAQQPAQVDPQLDTKARSMGWVPQNEWKGDPSVWRPADEYVRRGEEVLPIVRARERQANEKVKTLEAKFSALEQSFEERTRRLDGMTRVALERQRAQLENAYESAKRKAVADGDIETYDRLADDGRKALAGFDPESEAERLVPARQPAQQTPQVPEVVTTWIADNSWFDRDDELREYASFEHGRLLKRMPGLSLEDNLERTKQAVMEKYPAKFGGSRQAALKPHSPSVEGGGRQAQGSNGRVKGWNDLPPEAKQAAMNNITREKLWVPIPKGVQPQDYTPTAADIKAGQNAYAESYWEQEV